MPEAPKRTPSQRRSYTSRRAERTASTAHNKKMRWTITDARVALDPTLSVPEAALRVGRTAAAVENLRRKWRLGKLAAGLADQVPPPPRTPESGEGSKR